MKINSLIILIIFLTSCVAAQEQSSQFAIKGVSFEAPKSEVTTETLKPLQKLGANWVSIMPYAFTKNDSPDIQFNSDWQWNGEREQGVIESINSAKENKLSILMKPHLWVHSKFTGDVIFETEEDWKRWEDSYAKYILFYAALSEKYKVEMFCIGTELKIFVNARPEYWLSLIEKVRSVYSGKITYAANWDNYNKIPFWKTLDYIGVDAYFPLSDEKIPTERKLIDAWDNYWDKLKVLSDKEEKQIIFTEIGYRSIDYCAKEPWVSYEDLGGENQEAQSACLKTFFETSANKTFFSGAFLWKWHCPDHSPGKGNKQYTFQNKEAQEVVKSYY